MSCFMTMLNAHGELFYIWRKKLGARGVMFFFFTCGQVRYSTAEAKFACTCSMLCSLNFIDGGDDYGEVCCSTGRHKFFFLFSGLFADHGPTRG